MDWYIKCLQNYASIKGRARRKEYWMFFLFNLIISFCIGFVVGFLKLPALISTVYSLAVFIPGIAVGVRRIQDTNHSGWFLIVPFYNLYLLCIEGDQGDNRFGPNPKSTSPEVNAA